MALAFEIVASILPRWRMMPLVEQESLDVGLGHRRDALRLEVVEDLAERRATPQDRDPRQAGLESFEAELLVEGARVALLAPPFLIVIAPVLGIAAGPGTARAVRRRR